MLYFGADVDNIVHLFAKLQLPSSYGSAAVAKNVIQNGGRWPSWKIFGIFEPTVSSKRHCPHMCQIVAF